METHASDRSVHLEQPLALLRWASADCMGVCGIGMVDLWVTVAENGASYNQAMYVVRICAANVLV